MADFTKMLMNPGVLHLQKLELKLKCPLCLKLLNRPVLLPCDHVFCDSCIHVESDCAVCKSKHPRKARRNLHISIYKSLNAAVSVHHNSNSHKDGGSQDSDKDVIKRSGSDSSSRDGSPLPTSEESNPGPKQRMVDHLPLYEFEPENDASNRTPESNTVKAAKSLSKITASEQLDKSARKRICGDSSSHDDSLVPNSQVSNLDSKTQDRTVQLLMEGLRLYDFQLESDIDHVKAQEHQLPESHTEQATKRKCDIISSETMEYHQKVPKRQKNLMQNAADIDFNDYYSTNSDDQLVGKTSKASDLITPSSNITICGFCKSATVSEASGEMLHYSRGRPVVGDDIFHSNVIHVHSACIEWYALDVVWKELH